MSQPKWACLVWLFAALFGVVITVVFRTTHWLDGANPLVVGYVALEWQWPVTIIASVAAAIVGLLLIWRPTRGIMTWSGLVGVAWLVIYAWLTYSQRAELAAWTTDVFLGALGVIAAALSLTRSVRQG